MRLHGVPISIISNQGPQFTYHFWRAFQEVLGTRLDLNTAFHPQTNGQFKRTIQILEDMLRACVLDFSRSWSCFLSLIEFSYNNGYQSNIHMAPFKALRLYMKDIVNLQLASLKLAKPSFWGQI